MKELYCYCHTVAVEGKENIIKLAQEYIDNMKFPEDFISDSVRKWYQLAISNELIDPIKIILRDKYRYTSYPSYTSEWIMYDDIQREINTRLILETELYVPYSVIAVITSYDEMIKSIENGFVNKLNGTHVKVDINNVVTKNSLKIIQNYFKSFPNCIFTIEIVR
jgi:hypothetical protein